MRIWGVGSTAKPRKYREKVKATSLSLYFRNLKGLRLHAAVILIYGNCI